MRLTPGTVLARRYRLSGLLGEGGMGEVWAARHLLTGKAVAVKRLICAAHERGFGEARARFALEAQSACAVEHPNVVEVFDFIDSDDEGPFIVMELLLGETLAARLERGPIGSAREVAELMLPVVSAVGTAHERGIIHRDLKPSNIFIGERPGEPTRDKIKVLDFGIAKWLAGSRDERGLSTRTGSALGTPSYMAPEQATAERSADHRVDIWSLGVILYEATSGVRPLEGENAAQLVMRLLSSGIMPIEQLVPELPEALSTLIARMLSRDVARRPADLREVYAVLCEIAGLESLPFGPPRAAGANGTVVSAPADANAATRGNATSLQITRREGAQEANAPVSPAADAPRTRASTATRTSVDALAATAQVAAAARPIEASEAPAHTTRAAFSSDELGTGSGALDALPVPAPRRRRNLALAGLLVAAASLAAYALEVSFAAPPATQPPRATTASTEAPLPEAERATPAAAAPAREGLAASPGKPLEGAAREVHSAEPRSRDVLPRGGDHDAQRLDAWALDGWALGARGLDTRRQNVHAAPSPRRSKSLLATKRRGARRGSSGELNDDAPPTPSRAAASAGADFADTASPGGEASSASARALQAALPPASGTTPARGGAGASGPASAPRKKPKGAECDSSPECRSELCVAYTCQ